MLRTLVVAGAAVVVMSVAGAPTAAAADSWTMPSLKGMSLTEAQAAYAEAVSDSGGPTLGVVNQVVESWSITAPSMWDVCAQSPAAGKKVSAKTSSAVGVKGRGDC
jgi:beta-lactam-binding protein with PASTA domain